MSFFSYGALPGTTQPDAGVVFDYLLSQGMDDLPIMSEDGSEYLYTERTIKFRAVFHPDLDPAIAGETPSATLARVRRILETPRLQLFYFHNAGDTVPLCQSPQPGFQTDAKLGPQCRRLRVSEIRGTESFFVEAEYVTWVLDCVGPSPYISHRWTESVTIDEEFYSTKTRTGKIVVRADGGLSPDSLRGLVCPPICPGFKRMRSDYVMQSDGLALQYTFQDREQFIPPPLGAVMADGDYTESTADGGQRWAECRVKLRGPKAGPFSDRAQLLQTAIQIVVQKLDLGGLKRSPEGTWLAIGGVREALWANEVEVRFKTIIQPLKTSKTDGSAVDLSRFNSPLYGVDTLRQICLDPGTGGTAQLGLIANALNDPCLGQFVPDGTSSISTGGGPPDDPSGGQSSLRTGGARASDPSGTTGQTPTTLRTVPVLPDSVNAYRLDTTGVYSDYWREYHYSFDEQIVVLSTAMSGAPAAAVQLGQGTMTLVCEWRAERYKSCPVVPSPRVADPNCIFLRGDFRPAQLDVAADGVTPVFRVSGRYYYAYLDRSKASIAFPVPPYLDGVSDLIAVPGQAVQDQSPPSSGSGTNVLTGVGAAGSSTSIPPF